MKKWELCIGLSLLLAACASDEMEVLEPRKPIADGKDVAFRISFAEPQASLTKALTEIQENLISTLDILVFKKGATSDVLDAVFVEKATVTGLTSSGGAQEDVTATISSSTDDLCFVLVANKPSTPDLSSLTAGTSKVRDLRDLLTFSASTDYGNWKESNPSPVIPMWGQTALLAQPIADLPQPIDVDMVRSIARIDVGIDINNYAGGDPAIGFGSIFEIQKVYLCNVNDRGYIAAHDTLNNPKTGFIEHSFNQTGSRIMQRTIYAPRTESLIIQGGDTIHKPPYLVVEAKYYDNDDISHFYRIDFTQGDNYIPLLHNRLYTVNITGIRTVGYATKEEAMNAPILPVNPHLILGNEEATKSIRDIVYTNQYWLGCEATDVKLDWELSGGMATMQVGTSHPAGWTAELIEGSSWLPTSNISQTSSRLQLTVSDNTTGIPRTAKIKLTAGTLTQYVSITQSPGSNTYMVKNGGSVRIPLMSANMDGVTRVVNPNDVTAVRWCYEGAISSTPATINAGVATIGPVLLGDGGGGTVANGVSIIVTAEIGEEYKHHTWHVWVLPANVDFEQPASQKYYNGYTFMDRNLLEWGKRSYYQWGRRIPMSYLHEVVDHPVDIAMADTAEVYRFYTSPTSPYDWAKNQHNNLWSTIDGEKGYNDPCPFGWRVPPAENDESSPWHGFKNGQNGMKIPYNGYLDWITATGVDDGNAPLVWGASARGTDAYAYNALTGAATKFHRAAALPVRCIRDVKRSGGLVIAKGIN